MNNNRTPQEQLENLRRMNALAIIQQRQAMLEARREALRAQYIEPHEVTG